MSFCSNLSPFPKTVPRNKRNKEERNTKRKASSFVNHRQTSGWPRPPRAGQASPSTNLLGGKYSWNKKTSTRRWLADGQLERSLPGNMFEPRWERLARSFPRKGATSFASRDYRSKNCFEFFELSNEKE